MKLPIDMPLLKGFRFPRAVVAYAVWVYYRFALSTGDDEPRGRHWFETRGE